MISAELFQKRIEVIKKQLIIPIFHRKYKDRLFFHSLKPMILSSQHRFYKVHDKGKRM